jgi:hypothetical protein
MKKYLKRIFGTALLLVILFLGTVLYLAQTQEAEPNIGNFKHHAQIFSKNFVMSNYGNFEELIDDEYAPTIFDEDYVFENLNDPYFEKIRNDSRLRRFYFKETYDLHDYLEMREYLRDQFPHGDSSMNHFNDNLLTMLDEAEHGEKFICGYISKMLCQMIMASGTYARTVRVSDKIGLGHVVVEYWSKEYDKWILLDPDYNVYYTTLDSVPLNGIELYQLALKNEPILRNRGRSLNTLFNSESKLFEKYYSNGVAVDFYDKWASKNYPNTNPIASPINSCIYIGHNKTRNHYFTYHFSLSDTAVIKLIYANPFKH